MLLTLVFFPMLAAIGCYLLGRRDKEARNIAVIVSCAVTLLCAAVMLVRVAHGRTFTVQLSSLCGFGLSFEMDGFRALYAVIAGVMWLATSMLSREYFAGHERNRNRYELFFLLTLGATLGVFLSRDLFTTFIFFEMMSFTSYVWVAHDETPEALRAAQTYLAVAIIGGMVMLFGLFLLKFTLGTLVISDLHEAASACADKKAIWAASLCILLGFGAKAGMFPLHIWLPRAHPVAPAPASALLSGILTKTGVFGVIAITANIFGGNAAWGHLLLVLALITMVVGAVLAVFSVNLKRTLACSSVSQIGFILTGMAMSCLLAQDNALAARGALLYMLNHSLFKLILFMAAGVVYMNLHKLDLNDVRGFGRGKPLLHFAFLMGALGLMGVPLFSGYVSKTLIHEGIVEYAQQIAHAGGFALPYTLVEWAYLLSGGLTGAYMTKLYICLFWEKHPTQQSFYDAKSSCYMKPLSAIALGVSAAIVPILGIFPNRTMDAIADFAGGFLHAGAVAHPVAYFSLSNIKGACISLAIAALVYVLLIRRRLIVRGEKGASYADLWPKRLDMEERIYRPALRALLRAGGRISRIADEQVLENRVVLPLLRCICTVLGVLAKALGEMTDALAALVDSTLLSAHSGVLARNAFVRRTVARLDGVREGTLETVHRATHTMSYGLLLMGIGLCITLIYLLFYR